MTETKQCQLCNGAGVVDGGVDGQECPWCSGAGGWPVKYVNEFLREVDDEFEYFDGDGWLTERDVCRHCMEERNEKGKPFRWADEQYSFGVYAGRYCEQCWPKSGYRDAVDPDTRFDPADAGERMEDDY